MVRIITCCALAMAMVLADSTAQDVSYDIEIGKKYSQAVEMEMGVYDDVRLTEYVERIGRSLVAGLGDQPFEYSFKVADTDIPNAFALPGGYTYVTRGLLAIVNDDSELAGVMAHEIIHVHRRHSVKQQKRGFLPSLLKLPGEIVGAVAPTVGALLVAPVELTQAVFDANYSRGHEKEADKMGIALAQSAGFNPYGLPAILSNLGAEMELESGEVERRSLTNDHPVTEKRLNYLEKDINKLDVDKSQLANRPIDKRVLEGVIYGPNPAQGVFIENQFIHPDLEMSIDFPKSWEGQNTPVMVGAVDPQGEAIWVLSATANDKSPQQYYDTITNQFPDEYDQYISQSGEVSLNGYHGYQLALEETESAEGTVIRIVWLQYDDMVYQLTGYGFEKHKSLLEGIFDSFRKATEEQVRQITYRSISFIEAENGDNLQTISDRSGQVLDVNRLAILNGISLDDTIEKGTAIKVIVEHPYLD